MVVVYVFDLEVYVKVGVVFCIVDFFGLVVFFLVVGWYVE